MSRRLFLRASVAAGAGLVLACGDSGTSPDSTDSVNELAARLRQFAGR